MEMLYTLVGVIVGGILGVVLWESRKHKIDNLTVILLLAGLILVLFSIYAPILFTQYSSLIHFDEDTGVIGDTIGGIMNPFISIAAVIVMGLAFYAQYRANDMVRKQFELQKFENQFYEMLRLHKENVNEIEVKTDDGQKVIKGRDVFYEMKLEFEVLLNSLNYFEKDKVEPLDDNILYDMYDVFFFGLNLSVIEQQEDKDENFIDIITGSDTSIKHRKKNQVSARYHEWIEGYEENIYTKFQYPLYSGGYNNFTFREKLRKDGEKVNLQIALLGGHHSYLGHYYRNLFHMVKYVVEEDFLDKSQKLDYLSILRSQLSNYEQIMLFYNWLGSYGKDWENEQNHFFTEYEMIKNLWYDILYKDNFIKEKLKELVKKYKEQGGEGSLFEIGDDIDEKFS